MSAEFGELVPGTHVDIIDFDVPTDRVHDVARVSSESGSEVASYETDISSERDFQS